MTHPSRQAKGHNNPHKQPGYPWNPWKDGESITVWFSPDGIKDITADFKEWDKYMYVRVGLRKPNIFQIVK